MNLHFMKTNSLRLGCFSPVFGRKRGAFFASIKIAVCFLVELESRLGLSIKDLLLCVKIISGNLRRLPRGMFKIVHEIALGGFKANY